MNNFETVQTWLRNTYNIGVSSEWLTACLEWVQQENQGVLPSMNELVGQVYEQWLLSDLTEIGEPVLPQGLDSEDTFELISNYPLQLLSLVDVGFPLYGQKQKLQGRINPNDEVSADRPYQPAWEPKASRMLLLQLTDGHTQVQAMEYKQIKDLHSELPSGLKILVSGRLLCRRGMIMLTPECVQVLGGEVDSLVEHNTPLANLENAMIRNREDEGKHAKKQFSGRFITRGVDKKLDSSQKHFTKTSDYNTQNSHQKMSNSTHIKLETHELVSANHGRLLDLKQETSHAFLEKTELLSVKQASEQWKDEINYEDCFGDEFNIEEIDALDSTSATKIEAETCETNSNSVFNNSNSLSSVSVPCERGKIRKNLLDQQNIADTIKHSGNTFNKFSQSTDKNQAWTSSLDNKSHSVRNLSDVDVNDMEFFNDDFEIDEISFPTVTDVRQNKMSEIASASKIVKIPDLKNEKTTVLNQSCETKFLPKSISIGLNHKTATITSCLHEQNYSSVNSRKSSQVILNNVLQSDSTSTSIKTKPALSTCIVSTSRHKLFPVKSSPRKSAFNSDSLCRTPVKKQWKLSDMFRLNRTRLVPFDDNDDCSIIDEECATQSKQRLVDDCFIIDDDCVNKSSPLLLQKNVQSNFAVKSSPPKLVGKSSLSVFNSSSNISASAADCAMTSGSCLNTKMEWGQVENNVQDKLPKAVIHPLSTDCDDSLDISNSLPYQYLSDFANMQPPASITVKAYISTLTGKLGSNQGAYLSLACTINDGTSSLDVDLANSVLTELVGFSAQEIVTMRQRMKTEPQLKDILKEALSRCQEKLINISCLMEVDAVSVTSKPVVKRLIPLSGQHVNELIKRVEKVIYIT